jgi:hypothetical protein
MDIQKIFVINLKDKEHRFRKFEEIGDNRIERFEAIDSRNNWKVCRDYGLDLNLVGLPSDFYFSQARGAIGAYVSHYLLWKKIIEEDIESALILEDDACSYDLSEYLKKDHEYKNIYNFWQLGKRCYPDVESYTTNFNGLEAYILNQSSAKILVSSTHDNCHFNGIIKVKPLGSFGDLNPNEFSLFKGEPEQLWNHKNSITCAVDKFVGYCANLRLPIDKRLFIKLDPTINLFYQNMASDIMRLDEKPWWERTEKELLDLMNQPHFKYWENE